MTQEQREIRKLKRGLKSLTKAVQVFLGYLDEEMKQPSTVERGKRIAKLSNTLEMTNDHARYFDLGIDHRKDRKRKNPNP